MTNQEILPGTLKQIEALQKIANKHNVEIIVSPNVFDSPKGELKITPNPEAK